MPPEEELEIPYETIKKAVFHILKEYQQEPPAAAVAAGGMGGNIILAYIFAAIGGFGVLNNFIPDNVRDGLKQRIGDISANFLGQRQSDSRIQSSVVSVEGANQEKSDELSLACTPSASATLPSVVISASDDKICT